jgi:hypothetical protein
MTKRTTKPTPEPQGTAAALWAYASVYAKDCAMPIETPDSWSERFMAEHLGPAWHAAAVAPIRNLDDLAAKVELVRHSGNSWCGEKALDLIEAYLAELGAKRPPRLSRAI